MATVECKTVNKIFPGGVQALHDLSFRANDGEFLVLVGPSGCGKSTALRLIAGLEAVTSGTVQIGDECVNDRPPQRRDIAMVFQNYALYPHKTVRKNLDFPLRMMKMGKDERRERIARAAKLLGLEDKPDRKPKELSGGQRQRVAMGRAIVRDPAVFLMDEPLSNLDAKLRVEIRAEIAELQRRIGITTIYVTHDQVEAMTLGDRVAVLRDGRLQQIAPAQQLYEHPVNTFVASFIGSPRMNIFQTKLIRSEKGQLAIRFGSLRLPVPDGLLDACKSLEKQGTEEILAGLRPEAFVAPGSVEEKWRLQTVLRAAEELGHEEILYLDSPETMHTDEGQTPEEDASDMEGHTESTMVARFPAGRKMRLGEAIMLGVDVSKLYIFRMDGSALS
ncbi:MAG: ABC transporter ATP-binding protein [Candidatus Pacebacteria bacterium]|nr:ABC transporter ATP-binding protein [Candidatus Paceibacterota bacterium]